MNNISQFLILSLVVILFSCNSNKSDQTKDFSKLESNLFGTYRISSGGGYGVVLTLKDSTNFDYLQWIDVGGYFFGRKGKYSIKRDTLYLELLQPICKDTHYVRLDTLIIQKWKNTIVFKPKFIENEWDIRIDPKTNKVISGQDCFAKVAEINENYYQSLEISNWDTLIGKNSIQVVFPPAPPRPKINIQNEDFTIDEKDYN